MWSRVPGVISRTTRSARSPGGVRISPESGAAVALDADSTFHRIQTVGDVGARPPRNEPRMRLARDGKRRWRLQRHRRDQVESMGSYGSGDLRFSLSWKAYCFPNESERRQWASSVEELSLGSVVDRLVAELVARNKISTLDHGLTDFELSRLLIDEFIPFPEPALPARSRPWPRTAPLHRAQLKRCQRKVVPMGPVRKLRLGDEGRMAKAATRAREQECFSSREEKRSHAWPGGTTPCP